MTATADLLSFHGDRLRIDFRRFDLDAYALFLKAKRLPESDVEVTEDLTYALTAPARFAPLLGVPVPRARAQDLAVASHLYDDQAEVLRLAMDAKRFACWCDCGWGKTPSPWSGPGTSCTGRPAGC